MTLLFRRLLALADWLPPVPYTLSALLSGPIARLLCFGINSNDYAARSQAGQTGGLLTGSGGGQAFQSKSMGSRKIGPSRGGPNLGEHVSLVEDVDEQDSDSIDQQKRGTGSATVEIPGVSESGALNTTVYLTGGQLEWMQMIIFCDRVMFIFYALIMVPRLV